MHDEESDAQKSPKPAESALRKPNSSLSQGMSFELIVAVRTGEDPDVDVRLILLA